MLYNIFIYIMIFYIGSAFGSFLNAIAIRISEKLEELYNNNYSFFKELLEEIKLLKLSNNPKRSYCPVCKNKLKWYHNIPIFSYLFLRGKCAYCKTKIPIIYLISELLLGTTTLLIYYKFYVIENLPLLSIISLLIGLYILYIGIVVDIRKELIPDFAIILSIPFFMYFSYFYNHKNLDILISNFYYSIIFFIFSFCFVYFYYKFFDKLLIGIADLKIFSLNILLIGLNKYFILLFFLANYLTIPFIIYKYVKIKEKKIYFGPFIYISFIIVLLYKEEILNFLF